MRCWAKDLSMLLWRSEEAEYEEFMCAVGDRMFIAPPLTCKKIQIDEMAD
jgi:hypothetical protein